MQRKANGPTPGKPQRANIGDVSVDVSVDAASDGARASDQTSGVASGVASGAVDGDYLKLLLSHERRFEALELENYRLKARCEALQQQNIEQLQTILQLQNQSGTGVDANESSVSVNSQSAPHRRAEMKPESLDELPVFDKSEFDSVKPKPDVSIIQQIQQSVMQFIRLTQESIISGGRWCMKLLF